MESINDILKKDAECRYSGIADDLFSLNELRVDCAWKYFMPTITRNRDFKRINYVRNIKTFTNNFNDAYPELYNVPMTFLLVAGGAVRSILLDDNSSSKDVDIFLYGLKNVQDANARVNKFIVDIYIKSC